MIAPTDSSDPLRQHATPSKPKVLGNNLAELWVNFLIAESEQDTDEVAASSVTSTPRSKSSSSSDSSLFINDEYNNKSNSNANISALKLQIPNISHSQSQNHPSHFTLQPPSPNFERGVRNDNSNTADMTLPLTEAENSRFRPRVNSDETLYEDVKY